jgi:hypothetical protein
MLDDFYLALSASYGATGDRVARSCEATTTARRSSASHRRDRRRRAVARPAVAVGRRLVGDTLLIARCAAPADLDAAEEKKVEPVFTDLLAAHSRRMSAIGLDA